MVESRYERTKIRSQMARAKGPEIFGPDFGPFTLLVRFAAKADPKTGHGRTPGLKRTGSAIKHCFIINVLRRWREDDKETSDCFCLPRQVIMWRPQQRWS